MTAYKLTAAGRLARLTRRYPVEGANGVVQMRRVGEDHPRADLTNHEVELIRQLWDEGRGLGYRRIAAKFEISRESVRDIIKGRRRIYG